MRSASPVEKPGPRSGRVEVGLGAIGTVGRRWWRVRFMSGAAKDHGGERDSNLPERLDRDEEPDEEEQQREELADLEVVRDAEPVQGVPAAGEEAANRDEDRRQDAAVEPARDEGTNRARQRCCEVYDDRDGRDQKVEQEMVAGLIRVE